MSLSIDRPLQIVGIGVSLLLLWLAFYPGTVASPYVAEDSYRYSHHILPETAAGYDDFIEEAPTHEYSELSPLAQTFVTRTRESPTHEYTPTVCQEFMLSCDQYSQSELPGVFTYGDELSPEEATVVIRDGEERFVLQTGMVGHGWFSIPVRWLTACLTVVPLGLFVGAVALRSKSRPLLSGAIGAGVLVALFSVAAPYIEMFVIVIQAQTIGFVLLGGVWSGLFTFCGHRLSRRLE